MLGHTFYHGLIRKYVVLFGTLFNDITITHDNPTKNTKKSVLVPITYGPHEKVLARVLDNPALDKMPQITLPQMSFELMDFQYDPTRKLTSTGRNAVQNPAANNELYYQYNPVPYNLMFTLSIMVKNMDDGLRIIEQILPFFTPEFTLKARMVPEMERDQDIAIVLDSVRQTDVYEGNFEERRVLMWDLGFTLKAALHGPIQTGGVITLANVNFLDATAFGIDGSIGNTELVLETLTVVPGLTANGEPTTNADATIDRSLIAPNSNFDYVVTITPSL